MKTERRASPFEILGAWLHIWTPPRDVEVPPVPWRKVAIGTLIAAVVCSVAAALIVPAINRGKDRRARAEQAQAAAARAAERRRLIHEQRPRRGRAPELRPSRAALLARVERDISRDAAARARTGELKGPLGRTTCSAATDARPAPGHAVLDCLTAVTSIPGTANKPIGVIGYPFRAVLDYRTFAYVWCKTNPTPGELVIPDPRTVVELPPACRGR